MAHGIEEFVKLAPAVWPAQALKVQPGNLSLFVPMGNGIGAPLVMRTWDDPETVASRGAYYGFHEHSGHPFLGAPITESGGGTIYFRDRRKQSDIDTILHLMEVHSHLTDYVAFVQDAENPRKDRYLTQMRIVSGRALEFLFRIKDEPESRMLREQPLPVGDVIWKFVDGLCREHRERRYPIEGALGGDGDWAYESLAFGFMVENAYHSIYRVWTRAWLVTK